MNISNFSQLTMINENGETIEDGVEAMKFENNDSHSEDSITTNNNNVVKRPKLLSMISIGSRKSKNYIYVDLGKP